MKQERVYESFLFEWNDEKRDKYENAIISVKKYKKRSRKLIFLNIITIILIVYLCITREIVLIEDINFLLDFITSLFN